ncbi:MAG TPA: sigma-70 family RNA polymerase sigma factor [Fibrobacteraceae bacterium]|jgi:RNA polymerase sigma-70 factor (ECF subfamily)|nr:sigma-70 family RNA polymerase sigma factor [Fibrobacteraceae bacterium]HQB65681.1 sigma-70 family RNA polymerase sigma factor [Fibrobacteraceae bacterium]
MMKSLKKEKFELIYQQYMPMVLRRCRFLLKNEEEAFDVAQDVFIRILSKQDSLDLEAPSSLLWNSATRLCLNRIRNKTRRDLNRPTEDLLCQIACVRDERDDYEHQYLLSKLFQSEPASSRTIAVLHFIDGMTFEETARNVGLTVGQVRYRLNTLQKKLKSMEEK